MLLVDLEEGELLAVNEALLELTGMEEAPETVMSFIPADLWLHMANELISSGVLDPTPLALLSKPEIALRARCKRVDGEERRPLVLISLESNADAGLDHLNVMAFSDPLTGLPNRPYFLDRIMQLVRAARLRPERKFAVLLLDLDRFKVVNDSLGHLFGDSLLIDISRRLKDELRNEDIVARLGGDEFGMLLDGFDQAKEVLAVARRLLRSLEQPFHVGEAEIHIDGSIGVVLNTQAYKSAQDLIRDADTALNQAKRLGKGRFTVFNPQLHRKAMETMRLENELRNSVKNKEFELYYQPILLLSKRRVQGLEALLRWRHPKLGILGPDEFLETAEETGLIVPIGAFVLDEACAQLRRWRDSVPEAGDLSLNVNISSRQLYQKQFPRFVAQTLARHELPGSALKLEVTEHALIEDSAASHRALSQLKELGVGLVIDDFGTGYSSLSYLRNYPFDYLKVDRSFVSGPNATTGNEIIVRAIITLAKGLGLGVVAEGIENEDQAKLMEQLECAEGQGYLFSRPVPGDAAIEFFKLFSD